MASNDIFSYDEKRGFFQRFGLAMGLGSVVVVAVIVIWKAASSKGGGPPPRAEMVILTPVAQPPQPTPPPPPPNPVPNNTPPQETNDQPMIAEQNTPVEAPADQPPEGLGTNVTGTGGPDYGLGHSGNGMIGGTGKGTHAGGSRFRAYAAKLQLAIVDALRQNPQTRNAKFSVNSALWEDAHGKIIRTRLVQSTGNAELDRAISEVLQALQLDDEPPAGMPMPIRIRLNARRPN